MFGFRTLIAVIAIAAPIVVYVSMKMHEDIVVAAAIKGERIASKVRFEAATQKMETQHNAQVADEVAAATAAAEEIVEPETDQDLVEVCNRSASCRARKK